MTYHKLAQIQMATMSIQINWKRYDTTVHLNNRQQGKNTSKGHVQNSLHMTTWQVSTWITLYGEHKVREFEIHWEEGCKKAEAVSSH